MSSDSSSNELIEVAKFSSRVLDVESPAIHRRIERLREFEYVALRPRSWKPSPAFTVTFASIIFNGKISYIEQHLQSLYEQDYTNTEYILVDNGTTGEARELLDSYLCHPKTLVLRFSEHHYAPHLGDASNPWSNLINAALFASTGDAFSIVSYDDWVSSNYASAMAQLFLDNEKCNSASPGVVCVDSEGSVERVISESLQRRNERRRYVSGLSLARAHLNHNAIVAAPGEILSFRSSNAIKLGGIDLFNDFTQVLRLAVDGDSGYDPAATLFWRHHSQQSNKELMSQGTVFFSEYLKLDQAYQLTQLYARVATDSDRRKLQHFLRWCAVEYSIGKGIRQSFEAVSLRAGLRATWNSLRQAPVSLWLYVLAVSIASIPIGAYRQATRTLGAIKNSLT